MKLNNKPALLSIITVVKNCESTISRCIRSVMSVKKYDIEYIIIDGCSVDNTCNEIKKFSNFVDKFISEPDSGVYDAMNKGVSLASGKYIMFLNGDDEIIDKGFAQFINMLGEVRADIFSGVTLVENINGTFAPFLPRPCLLPFISSVPHPSSAISRKILLRYKFREDLKIAADYDFFLRSFLNFSKFKIIYIPLVKHYMGGISGNLDLNLDEARRVRKDRLGWLFYFFLYAHEIYRIIKYKIMK